MSALALRRRNAPKAGEPGALQKETTVTPTLYPNPVAVASATTTTLTPPTSDAVAVGIACASIFNEPQET
jgi:hypothetical protein